MRILLSIAYLVQGCVGLTLLIPWKFIVEWQRKKLSVFSKNTRNFGQGSSINDVTALGGRGCQGFCDNSTKALFMKCVTMGEGSVRNNPNLRDVIYGWPLIANIWHQGTLGYTEEFSWYLRIIVGLETTRLYRNDFLRSRRKYIENFEKNHLCLFLFISNP
jgi:hypothetical protein